MKNFFLISIVAITTATLTTTAFAANAILTWNGSAGVIGGSNFYDFNNGGNWVGGVAPDGTDAVKFDYTGVRNIRFTADTTLFSTTSHVFSHGGATGNTIVVEGSPLTLASTSGWIISMGGTDTSLHFTNTVTVQANVAATSPYLIVATNSSSDVNTRVANIFERLIIKSAADALGRSKFSLAASFSNTRNILRINELADFYTHPTDSLLSSTGTLDIGSTSQIITTIVEIDKTFGTDGDENYWEFTGAIAVNNGQLKLLSNLSPKCTFTMGGGSGNMLNLANGVQFTHTFNLVNYLGMSRLGILDTGSATISSNIAATRSVSAGALVNNVLFIAGLDSSTLIYSGKLTGASFIGGELQFQGNGYIFLRGNTANGNVPIGRFSGGTIGLANGTSEVVLGGNFSYDGPMKVYNGAGLTNQEGVMNFTNTVVDATVTVNPQAAGFDMSLMNTNGKLVFKLETPATTYQIQATLLNIGSLDSYEFFFLRGTGFGEGEYTLFSSPNAITSTFLDTLPFFLDQAQTWQGQLAWGADNKSILLNVVAVPEPATWLLLGASLLVVTLFRRKNS